MSNIRFSREDALLLAIRVTFLCAVSYFGIKFMVDAMDPTRKQRQAAIKKAREIMKKIGLDRAVQLSEHEMTIASLLVDPQTMDVSWDSIAGLDSTIRELRETVILPITNRKLFLKSKLIQPPKGVLLHGPPGCGKTMLAKATAKEAGARFINLQVSSLTDVWYGESQKLAAAVFSLAMKIQPTIIFIDEIDSFLRSRETRDHEATAMMKAQFMCLWDGLATDNEQVIVVLGATNRPQDVDKAILRRMPASFHVPMPNVNQRKKILDLTLSCEMVSADVDTNQLSLETDTFSGSDLRELCRMAAMNRVREFMSHKQDSEDDVEDLTLRHIKMDDFVTSLTKMKESRVRTGLDHLVRLVS